MNIIRFLIRLFVGSIIGFIYAAIIFRMLGRSKDLFDYWIVIVGFCIYVVSAYFGLRSLYKDSQHEAQQQSGLLTVGDAMKQRGETFEERMNGFNE